MKKTELKRNRQNNTLTKKLKNLNLKNFQLYKKQEKKLKKNYEAEI